MKFVICRGLPASGKSTWAKDWVAEDPDTRARVNRDDIRYSVFGKGHGVDEDYVTQIQHAAIDWALGRGKDVVSDDTNLNSKTVRKLVKIAVAHGAEIEWNDDFLKVPLVVCVKRDLVRKPSVGEDVIMAMYKRYFVGGKRPKRPEPVVGEVAKAEPYVPNPNWPWVVLVDLDGTIAHNDGHRGFFDWHKVGDDKPHKDVIRLVHMFIEDGVRPIFVSGREDVCFTETFNWIKRHVFDLIGKFDYNPILFMRKAGDGRKDSIVKLEIFDREIRNNYNVIGCLDDRNQVVDAYRSIGLRVYQVAPGNF